MSTLTLPRTALASPNLQVAATNLHKALTQSQADSAVVKMYVTAVLEQQDIVQKIVPDLPSIQAGAREVATRWNKVVIPKSTQTVSDLIAFANQWNAYSNHMLSYAHTISNSVSTTAEKEAARRNLDAMLGQVYDAVEAKETNATQASLIVSDFNSDLTKNNKDFSVALTKLRDAYAGKDGAMQKYEDEIRDLGHGIAKDATLIAISGLVAAGGVAMILVGGVADFITAGTSTPVVLAGIGLAAGSLVPIIGATMDMAGKIHDVVEVYKEQSEAKQNYAAVQVAIPQLSCLGNKCSDAVESSSHLKSLWLTLKNDVTQLRKDIQAINPGDYSVLHSIEYAKTDWETCLKIAQTIQLNTSGGNIPVKYGLPTNK